MTDAPTTQQLPLDTIICGDALATLRGLPSNSIDAIVTDPPSGTGFMGVAWDTYGERKGGERSEKKWDYCGSQEHARTADEKQRITAKQGRAFRAAMQPIFEECLRVLKPGGHALVWALPRTSHWTATALEDAGFEVRDVISHWFGSGFPKSHNLTGEWEGWGTALKPAAEFWWLCRKPLSEGTVAANVLAHGVGALNIDARRIQGAQGDGVWGTSNATINPDRMFNASPTMQAYRSERHEAGRWPAHLVLSHSLYCMPDGPCDASCPVAELDRQSGMRTSGTGTVIRATGKEYDYQAHAYGKRSQPAGTPQIAYGDTGGASRYFATFKYQAKASRSERNRGCEALGDGEAHAKAAEYRPNDPDENTLQTRLHGSVARRGNHHPTVKPLALMSWLIGLITPPHGIVLDCFAGSGSTLVAAKMGGWRYIGIEREHEYVAIIHARLAATQEGAQETATAETHREEVEPISIGSAVTLSSSSHATPAPTRQKPAKPAKPTKPTATRRKRPQPTITDSLQPSLFDTGTYLVWLKHVEQESPSA